ncbi:hypothetical protein SRHO_G00219440 [Serrasalmus rhombeus]
MQKILKSLWSSPVKEGICVYLVTAAALRSLKRSSGRAGGGQCSYKRVFRPSNENSEEKLFPGDSVRAVKVRACALRRRRRHKFISSARAAVGRRARRLGFKLRFRTDRSALLCRMRATSTARLKETLGRERVVTRD